MSLENMGGRKYLGFILILAVGAVVDLATAHGLSTNMLTLLISAYSAFSLGNVVTTAASLRVPPAPPFVEPPDLTQEDLINPGSVNQQQLDEISDAVKMGNQAHTLELQKLDTLINTVNSVVNPR